MSSLVVFVVSLIIASLFAVVLVSLLGWRRAGRDEAMPAILFLFTILFLCIWAAGLWLQPFGPTAWGVAWIPLFIVGMVVALVIAAAAPPTRRRERAAPTTGAAPGAVAAETALSAFFWMLLAVLAVAIIGAFL